MRKALLVATAASLTLTAALAGPASAADSNTTLTVSLTGGSLAISAPATATLTGSVDVGSVVTGNLGTTTVTDDTGSLLGWSVSAVTDGDLQSQSNAAATIALTAVGPLVADVSAITPLGDSVLAGLGVGNLVDVGAGGGLNATTPTVLATATPLSGGGSFEYDPGLTLVVPPNTYAEADYEVVITQSVV